MYEELRPLLMTLILVPDETAGSVGQNDEDGDDDNWAGWRDMSDNDGGECGEDEASEDVAEVEGGGKTLLSDGNKNK